MLSSRILERGISFVLIWTLACIVWVDHSVPDPHENVLNLGVSERRAPTDQSRDCVVFVGDTMVANAGTRDYAYRAGLKSPLDSFSQVLPLIRQCRHAVANLEGPITNLDSTHDPFHKEYKPAYSFQMNPRSVPKLLHDEVGITAVNRANNHLLDRGAKGVRDTDKHLVEHDIAWFGKGMTPEEALRPWIAQVSSSLSIAVTGFGPTRRASQFHPQDDFDGTIPVTPESIRLARRLMDDEMNAGILNDSKWLRIAFVHWGQNYGDVSKGMKTQARLLAQSGYNLILGSDGSHTVQHMDWIRNGKGSAAKSTSAVIYNIGNFVFSTPGRFAKLDATGYGSIVKLDSKYPSQLHLQMFCLLVDNREIHYVPRSCTPSEADDLFSDILPNIPHTREATASATIDLSRILQ